VPGDRTIRQKLHFLFFTATLSLKLGTKFKSFFSAKRFHFAVKKIPIYACGACSRARGVTEADLNEYGAKFGNPKIFVSLVEWADKIITE
jgi:sulfur relay (sulfurtransferase) complex TusBCD TusD component (DsrE family)